MEQRDLINKLFSWTHALDLKNAQNEVVMRVYQRLVGDLDIQKARMAALRFSRELRLKLRNAESDEYVALVQPVEDLDRDAMITLLLVDSVDEIRQNIDRNYYFAEPKEPDEYASTEEHEEYAAKWASWEADREKDYSTKLVSEMDNLKAKLELRSDADLLAQAKHMRIEALCEQELKTRFIEMCVVLGTYSDEEFKKRLFDGYQDYAGQHDSLKSQLLAGYAELEMSTIGLKESTKSQVSEPVSPSPQSSDSR